MKGKWLLKNLKLFKKTVKKEIYEKKRQRSKKKLKNLDFTIISNNCWAGWVYRYFDMPYLTPTVGLYFFTPDYIKFVSNLKHYLSCKLEFISCDESIYRDTLVIRGHETKPIGKIDDVEIVFLHYKSKEEAKEKWERRKARVNYENIILKCSQMNLCTDKELAEFDSVSHERKFVFTARKRPDISCAVYYPGYEKENAIYCDTNPFPKAIDIDKLLNLPKCEYGKNDEHILKRL